MGKKFLFFFLETHHVQSYASGLCELLVVANQLPDLWRILVEQGRKKLFPPHSRHMLCPRTL